MDAMVCHVSLLILFSFQWASVCQHNSHSKTLEIPQACGKDGICVCSNQSFTAFDVNCTGLGLTVIPRDIPTNTTWLNLYSNELSTLENGAFESLTSLQFLFLANNSLSALQDNIFADPTLLIVLDLRNNNLSALPEDVFKGLGFVETLQLSDNQLSTLPSKLFEDMTSLQYLAMEGNRLSTLPTDAFEGLHSLETLLLRKNNLTTLPTGIFNGLTSLAYLYLSENHLSSLPEEVFSGLRYLSCIDLRKNIFLRVTTAFGLTNFIYNLDLSDNNIFQITTSSANHSSPNNVETLFLQRNNLEIITRYDFIGFHALRFLSLYDNQIHIIEDNAFAYTKLMYLLLYQNNLSNITGNPFGSRNNAMEQIHLYGNKIYNVETRSLVEISRGTILYFNCESFQVLPRNPIHNKLICVGPTSMPSIHFQNFSLVEFELKTNGFTCNFHNESARSKDLRPSQNKDFFLKYSYTCTPCSVGSYGRRVTPSGCFLCPKGGFYQDEVAQTECKKCNVGLYVQNGGGISSTDCRVCPEGTNKTIHAGYRACFCKREYARTDRYGPCFLCKQKGLNCDEEFQALLPGYMWNWTIPSASIIDYKKFVENVNECFHPKTENTKYTGSIPRVFKCPITGHCPNDNDSIAGNCEVGYRGWLCTNCVPGYHLVLKSCVPCPSLSIIILECCIFLIICALVYFLLNRRVKQNKEQQSRSSFDIVVARIKILLGFYQVIGEILSSLDNISWTGSLVTIGKFITAFEVNILKLFVRPRCINVDFDFNSKLLFIVASITPLIIALVPFIYYLTRKLYVRIRYSREVYTSLQSRFQTLKTCLCSYVVVLWFIIYPPICSIIFSMYPMSCKSFALDQNDTYSITRLRSDLDLDCSGLQAYHIAAFLLTPVYVIGFPVIILYHLRKDYMHSHNYSSEIVPFGKTQNSCVSPVTHDSSTSRWIHFFCEIYKKDFWFWEIVELTRKVIQTLLITLYGWEDRRTVLLTTLTSVLFLLLHARYQPMKKSYEQGLQMLSLTVIFIDVTVASNYFSQEMDGSVAVFIALLNILLLIIITGEFVIIIIIMHLMKIRIITKLLKRPRDDIIQ